MSDFVPSFNPFRDYFDNLPQPASNVDYIKKLASQVKTTDQSYWEKCLRKWLVAAVACSIDDSVVNQTVLIFKGKQGIGKSTYLLNLVPGPLQSYIYSGVLNPSDKDTMSNLAECFLINLDELETLTK